MLPLHLRAPRFTLRVSQQIIDTAQPGDAAHCMIAQALHAGYPAARWVLVDVQSIRFTDRTRGFRYTYLTPHAVLQKLINFEHGTKPRPFTFLLAEGRIKPISKKPVKEASPKLRKAASKGRKVIKSRVKHKDTEAAKQKNIRPTHKRQFGIRAL